MSKHAKRRATRQSARGPAAARFTPVPVRPRHDGWTPARQIAFVNALAATACVDEACQAVGMSPRAYYTLRQRGDADSFRRAVDAALDCGIRRLGDAMLGRALHGVATPIFYKGEQIGERRRYDERLAMFLLRAHAPERYGRWRDDRVYKRPDPDGAAKLHLHARKALAQDVTADAAGRPRPSRPPLPLDRDLDDPAVIAAIEEEEERAARAKQEEAEAYIQSLGEQDAAFSGERDWDDDEEDEDGDDDEAWPLAAGEDEDEEPDGDEADGEAPGHDGSAAATREGRAPSPGGEAPVDGFGGRADAPGDDPMTRGAIGREPTHDGRANPRGHLPRIS